MIYSKKHFTSNLSNLPNLPNLPTTPPLFVPLSLIFFTPLPYPSQIVNNSPKSQKSNFSRL